MGRAGTKCRKGLGVQGGIPLAGLGSPRFCAVGAGAQKTKDNGEIAMYPKKISSSKNTPDCQLRLPRYFYHTACLVSLFFLIVLSVFPTHGVGKEAARQAGAADGVSRREAGFPVPRKGPLISNLREDVDPEIPGAETVIRRYEDSRGNVVQEFILNGALFQIEVSPVHGPTYYLIDVQGNGLFEERYQGHMPRLVVPQWVFFRF